MSSIRVDQPVDFREEGGGVFVDIVVSRGGDAT